MGKIVFYEERNFGGRHYVCMSDCSDLGSYFNHCNSIRVESGSFMIYELPNYRGHQYFLSRGEYPDYQRWMGISDKIRSCRMIPMHPRGSYQMRFYERMEFGGQMKELKEDCPNTMDHFHLSEIHSCNVMDGHWLFYDQSNYRGRMYYLRTGEYKRFSDWGGTSARVGSIRRIVAS